MLKKKLSIGLIIIMFLLSYLFLVPHEKDYYVQEVLSPNKFDLGAITFTINDLETFDSTFTTRNAQIAKELNITETEAFILGNLAKYWASNLMTGRKVHCKNNDLIFFKNSYKTKFLYSGYCLKNLKPYHKKAFVRRLIGIKRTNYKVLDLDTNKIYSLEDSEIKKLKNFIVLRKSHLPKALSNSKKPVSKSFSKGNIAVYLEDSTSKLIPDRDCSSLTCKKILANINSAQKTIDIAIYGYSTTYKIEEALKAAKNRGVNIRLVYDINSNGKNIYPDTNKLLKILPNNMNDNNSTEVGSIMHNKFYIFDNQILITGSANLSHTDMSGYNSNSIIILNSKELAQIYKEEFEKMFSGKFHSKKSTTRKNKFLISNIPLEIYFSPQDKAITNAVIPLIKNAKKYIYIPTFVLTEKRVTEELIMAKKRGVDVRIIIDALNASIKHSKHKELRAGEILVKTENYAGKMHSKSMIVDDEFVIIGSMNFSNSGENKNDENMILIKDSEIAKFYKDFFLYQWNKIDNKWLKQNIRAEGIDSIGSCFDGIDNNYDGLIDSQDPACSTKAAN